MCVCSGTNRDSNFRASSSRARSSGRIERSVGKMQTPMCIDWPPEVGCCIQYPVTRDTRKSPGPRPSISAWPLTLSRRRAARLVHACGLTGPAQRPTLWDMPNYRETANVPTPTKRELLEALRSSRDEVIALVRSLPPERFEEGRYENGWNGRQILAHIASIEWTYPRLIEIARTPAASDEKEPPTRAPKASNESYNDRQVQKRAHLGVAELLDEFERHRAATIAAVEATDEALLARTIRSAFGIVGPLASVFHMVAVMHVLGHAHDIAGSGNG